MFLVCVGHYGNASVPKYVAQWAGVCVGMVINATYHYLIAFLALHNEAVMMPPKEEKKRAKQYVEEVTCLDSRVAEWVPTCQRNKVHLISEAWAIWQGMVRQKQKLFYQLPGMYLILSIRCANLQYTFQIISLPQSLLIIDYSLGHTGSMHDAWAFRSIRTFKNHDKIFGPREWMWADSTYPPETWSIAPFKKPINGQLTTDQRTYNYWVSKVSCTLHTT